MRIFIGLFSKCPQSVPSLDPGVPVFLILKSLPRLQECLAQETGSLGRNYKHNRRTCTDRLIPFLYDIFLCYTP